MSHKRSIGSYMKKTVPKNAKYQHVKTRLDTGCSLTKYMEKMEEIQKNYRYQKDEIFKRLKATTFAQLVNSLSVVSDADLECLSIPTSASPRASLPTDHRDAGDARENCPTARSTLLSVISGMGELNVNRNDQKAIKEPVVSPEPVDRPYPDCPYLLLDVRDRDQYDRCHIISAYSFPIATLSRTMNPYTKEVLEYKNAAGKMIIVYDEDERIAIQAATTMCQRGFENLFMLSGGLKVLARKFPEGMTTGSIPPSCLSPPTSSKGKRSSVPPQPLQAAERRWRFTSDELAKIQEYMEEILIPSNSNSRMSSSSWQSKASSSQSQWSSSSRGSTRVQSSRPWK
uniref:Rhodanese domain-containing protein n=1 Tax=Mola mola TaxID=94237 RepID=A0A3Q4B2M1_MOLML